MPAVDFELATGKGTQAMSLQRLQYAAELDGSQMPDQTDTESS